MLGGEPAEGVVHDPGILPLTVGAEDRVLELVDQAQGVDLARPDGALRGPLGVDLMGERARRGEIGENDVAFGRKERVLEAVMVAGPPRDVKFEAGPMGPHAAKYILWARTVSIEMGDTILCPRFRGT